MSDVLTKVYFYPNGLENDGELIFEGTEKEFDIKSGDAKLNTNFNFNFRGKDETLWVEQIISDFKKSSTVKERIYKVIPKFFD